VVYRESIKQHLVLQRWLLGTYSSAMAVWGVHRREKAHPLLPKCGFEVQYLLANLTLHFSVYSSYIPYTAGERSASLCYSWLESSMMDSLCIAKIKLK